MTSVDPRPMANAIRILSMDAIERAGEGPVRVPPHAMAALAPVT
jgi:transketolase